MSLDKRDVQYAAKEICTKKANPTQGSWKRLKKAARYLKGVDKVTWAMRAWEHDEMKVDVHVNGRGFGLGQRPREVDEWRHDDGQRHEW